MTVQIQTLWRSLSVRPSLIFCNKPLRTFLSSRKTLSPSLLKRHSATPGNIKLVAMGSLAKVELNQLEYPKAHRDESVKDNYHGVEILDPYRWYEISLPEVLDLLKVCFCVYCEPKQALSFLGGFSLLVQAREFEEF